MEKKVYETLRKLGFIEYKKFAEVYHRFRKNYGIYSMEIIIGESGKYYFSNQRKLSNRIYWKIRLEKNWKKLYSTINGTENEFSNIQEHIKFLERVIDLEKYAHL